MALTDPAPQSHDECLEIKAVNNVPSRVRILVEIVGATDLAPHPELSGGGGGGGGSILPTGSGGLNVSSRLLLAGKSKASPYVRVNWGPTVIHTTDTVPDSNSPIWAADSGSLFLLDATSDDLVGDKPKALTFELRDKDLLLGKSAQLGIVRINANRLIESCTEERIEFDIIEGAVSAIYEGIMDWDDGDKDSQNGDGTNVDQLAAALLASQTFEGDEHDIQGKLALRFRLATEDDLSFIRCLKHGNFEEMKSDPYDSKDKGNWTRAGPGLITDKDEAAVGVQGVFDSFTFAFNSTTTDREGKVKLRVKPGPDPQRPDKTTFLSEAELLAASYAPSKNWVEAGSGELGKVFVEILRCEGLPNLDAGGAVGNKTDAFVSLVYEDAMVQSDRIDDSLSPLWMPWTQRAFAFNRMHPLSSLYIGVFDYDLGPSAHDGIGRIAINLEQFKPDTVYTLKYNLYPSSAITDRESMGTITIRLRIETPDEKALFLESIKQTPRIHVNVKKEKSLAVAKYTCDGQYDEDKYDMKLLRSYVNELLEYKRTISYSIGDALKSLLLWRGQVKIGVLNLPAHSIAAFVIGTYVVERPHLVPSLCCFCLAWFMLASYGYRIQHPSPWRRCRSIEDYIGILRRGKAPPSSTRVNARQGAKEAASLEQAWKNRLQADMDAANKRWEMQQALDGIGDEAIHTEQTGLQIDPLTRLFPIQRRLRGVCYVFRSVKSVISWEDSALSFWITALSIGLGVALFILPTVFLLHWLCRILVWIFLGPWMKLVDLTFFSSVDFENDEERRKHEENTANAIVKKFKEMSREARIRGEDALKLKAIRVLRFGKFIARVPSRNLTRHYDYPLPDSTAIHLKQCPSYPVPVKGWDNRKVSPGQKLHGAMVPLQGQSKETPETKDQLALLQKLFAERNNKAAHKNRGNGAGALGLGASTGLRDEKDLEGEEGIEIEFSDTNVQRGNGEQTIGVPKFGREQMDKIEEGDEDEASIGQMSSVASFMQVPSHITRTSGVSDGTSVSSSVSSDSDESSHCSASREGGEGEEGSNDEEVVEVIEEEGVEVVAQYAYESADENSKDNGAEVSSDKLKLSPLHQSSGRIYVAYCHT